MQKAFALVWGILIILFGILGFSTSNVFGIFSVNEIYSFIFFVVGLIGIYSGLKGTGKIYNLCVGWTFLVLSILGFSPGISSLLAGGFRINFADNLLNLIFGILILGIYYGIED